jgi:hypothetical protein
MTRVKFRGVVYEVSAMGIGRARKTVTLGCKASAASTLVDFLDPPTYTEVNL